ncbi:hypothetical protein E4K64_15425 [Bradyrhizobium frederickii]|uniref:Uncharacterized protein n=1 Tax=Bradyrhizobium frederickii TaxID=2560054 RepID=A0A4Y9P3Z6_9BRAD|nr:hypothetical protein E4K64_15425 [Bradyrhizobium frederickii]
MAGLDPAIHASPLGIRTWMPGTGPGMTTLLQSHLHRRQHRKRLPCPAQVQLIRTGGLARHTVDA